MWKNAIKWFYLWKTSDMGNWIQWKQTDCIQFNSSNSLLLYLDSLIWISSFFFLLQQKERVTISLLVSHESCVILMNTRYKMLFQSISSKSCLLTCSKYTCNNEKFPIDTNFENVVYKVYLRFSFTNDSSFCCCCCCCAL